jgi:integrase/recombinase XerD
MIGCESKNQLASQLNTYFDYLRDVKKSSDNTVQAYQRDLSKFYDYLVDIGIEDFACVDTDTIAKFKMHLNSVGLSSTSVSRTLSSMRGLYQFFVMNGLCEHNPAKAVHNDKAEKKDISVMTAKEVEALLAQPDQNDVKGIRDKAMLELLYATGIKVSELIGLTVDDFNAQLSFIRCGDGEKERFIPIYPVAAKAIVAYIEKSRKLLVSGNNEKTLFVNVTGDKMTRQGFWKILKAYAVKANIKKTITPHTLRNSFASHLLENGADIHDIQVILGHTDIASTQRYAQFLKDKMKNSYIKFHPRA